MHNLGKCVSFFTALAVVLVLLLFPPVEQNEAKAEAPTVDLMEYAVDLGPPTMETPTNLNSEQPQPIPKEDVPDPVGVQMSYSGDVIQPEQELSFLDRFVSYQYLKKDTYFQNSVSDMRIRHWPLE